MWLTVVHLVFYPTTRFLRHVPVVYVDYPGETSLKQIYGTFNRAMLRMVPSLRAYAEPLTAAMVEFYLMSQVGGSLVNCGGLQCPFLLIKKNYALLFMAN